jgi:large subunit ribosomal protein L21
MGYEIRTLSVCLKALYAGFKLETITRRTEAMSMYAIVKAGGRQEKVTVGETITVDRLDAAAGSSVSFPALLVVDGASVTTDPKVLSSIKVTGEVIDNVKGPKIDILRYKNKTGHRRRQGFRAQHTRVKITAISGAK